MRRSSTRSRSIAVLLSLFACLVINMAAASPAPGRMELLEFSIARVSPNTLLEHPAGFAHDSSGATAWKASSDGRDAWMELDLGGRRLVHGVRLCGVDGSEVQVLYADGKGWVPAPCSPTGDQEGWLLFDLSPLEIATARLRIVMQPEAAGDAGLAEIEVLGEDVLQAPARLTVVTTGQSGNTAECFPGRNLFDGNTYTPWETESNAGPEGWVEAEIASNAVVQKIRLFVTAATNATYSLLLRAQGAWFNPGPTSIAGASLRPGWNEIRLDRPATADALRLTAVSAGSSVPARLTECEVWGLSDHSPQVQTWQSFVLSGNDGYTTSFAAPIDDRTAGVELVAALSKDLTVALNSGEAIPLSRGTAVLPIAGRQLEAGVNDLRWAAADSAGATVLGATVRPVARNGRCTAMAENLRAITDRSVATAASLGAGAEAFLTLPQAVELDHLRLYVARPGQYTVRVSLWNGTAWVAPGNGPDHTVNAPHAGWYVLALAGAAGRIRLDSPGLSLGEVQVFGSPISDCAPQVTIAQPDAGTVVHGPVDVDGYVDNPDVAVTVNGRPAALQGNRFSARVSLSPAGGDKRRTITVTATDAGGRQGTAEVDVYLNNREPWVELDAPADGALVRAGTVTVMGTVNNNAVTVLVNGKKAPVHGRRFSEAVALLEGANRITIEVTSINGNSTTETITVWRDNRAPVLHVTGPRQGEAVSGRTVVVDGFVDDMLPVQVTVNGEPVVLAGSRFSTAVALAPGANSILVRAVDALGLAAEKTISVVLDEDLPRIEVDEPGDGALLKENLPIVVRGRVIEENLTCLMVNGIPVRVESDGTFCESAFSLIEGVNRISVRAEDAAGHVTTVERTVILDTTPPAPFTPQVLPEKWTRETTATVRFDTTDAAGGIDHYEISVDGREFVPAESPVILSDLTEGIHTVVVRAYDRAGWTTDGTAEIRVDLTPPLPFIPTASPGTWTSRPVTVAFETHDALSGVARYELSVDGGSPSEVTGPFTLPSLADGKHRVLVAAVDEAGNRSERIVDVYVDCTPPEPFEVQADPAGWTREKSPVLTFAAVDATSGVDHYDVRIDGGPWTPATGPHRLPELEDGIHAIEVRAVDRAELATTATTNVYIDTTPPEEFSLQVTPAGWTSNNRPEVAFETTDTGSGLKCFEAAVDDGEFAEASSPFQPEALPDGIHEIHVKAVDRVGNERLVTVKAFVDTVAPLAPPEFKVVGGDACAEVSWNMGSPDVTAYYLRRVGPDGTVDRKFDFDAREHGDHDLVNGETYTYTLWGVDRAGNTGPASQTTVTPGCQTVEVREDEPVAVEVVGLSIVAPAGALPEGGELGVKAFSPDRLPATESSSVAVGPAYAIGSAVGDPDNGGYLDDVALDEPAVLTFSYGVMDLPEGYDETDLHVYYFDSAADTWVRIEDEQLDPLNQTLSVTTDHFSEYAIRASKYQPPSLEEYENMEVSPYGSYFRDHNEDVAPESGSLSIQAVDVRLPGVKGLDFVLRRTYNSSRAYTEFREKKQQASINSESPWRSLGLGWEVNCAWMEFGEGGTFVHLPGGSYKLGRPVTEQEEGWWIFKQTVYAEYVNIEESTAFRTVFQRGDPSIYTVTTRDGRVYRFSSGLLRAISDLNGNDMKYEYDSKKRLTKVTDTAGRVIRLAYGSNGRLERVTYPGLSAGQTLAVVYGYDGGGELVTVTDPAGRVTRYDYYEAEGQESRTSVVEPDPEEMPDPFAEIEYVAEIKEEGWKTTVRNHNGQDYIEAQPQNTTTTRSQIIRDIVKLIRTVSYPSGGRTTYGYSCDTYTREKVATVQRVCRVPGLDESGMVVAASLSDKATLTTTSTQTWVSVTCRKQYPRQAEAPAAVTTFVTQRAKDGQREFLSRMTITQGAKVTTMTMGLVGEKNQKGDKRDTLCTERVISENGIELAHVEYQHDSKLKKVTLEKHIHGGTESYRISKQYDKYGNLKYQKNSLTGLEEWWAYSNSDSKANNGGAGFQEIGPVAVPADGVLAFVLGHSVLNRVPDKPSQPIQTVYVYDGKWNVTAEKQWDGSKWIETGYSYYPNGNLQKRTRFGSEMEYQYDQGNLGPNLLQTRVPGVCDADGLNPIDVVVKYTYYANGLRHTVTDANGHVTAYEYDAVGRVKKVTFPDLSSRKYDYDDAQDFCDLTDEEGRVARYQYDGLGHLVSVTRDCTGLKAVTAYGYDDAWRVNRVVEPHKPTEADARYTTQYSYDALDRVTAVVFPDDTPSEMRDNPTVTLDYEPVTSGVKGWKVTITDEEGHQVRETSDWAGRLVQAEVDNVDHRGQKKTLVWTFAYDSMGNKTAETSPKRAVDAAENTTKYEYDFFRRLTRQQLPEVTAVISSEAAPVVVKPTTTIGYDDRGNKVWEIGPNGNASGNPEDFKIEYTYDSMDRLVKVTEPAGSSSGQRRVTRTYYDAAGNKVRVVDGNGLAVTYEYDKRNRLKSECNALGERIRYTYDLVGNRTSVTDPRGDEEGRTFTTWYVYDGLYRQVLVVLPDATPPSDPIHDPGDNPYIENVYTLKGLKESERDPNGVVTGYQYDARGRVTEVSRAGVIISSSTYDKVGNVTSTTDAEGLVTAMEYDYLGQVLRQRQVHRDDANGNPAYDILTCYRYDELGNKVDEWNGHENRDDPSRADHRTGYAYDALGRLTNVTDAKGQVTRYHYDAAGNLMRLIDANGNLTRYAYDRLGQLTGETDALGHTTFYAYDDGGRRTASTDRRGIVTTYGYDLANRVKSVQFGDDLLVEYTYDPAGNRTSVKQMDLSDSSSCRNMTIWYNRDALGYQPDPMNRVVSVTREFGGLESLTKYQYDPAGNLTGILYPGSSQWVTYMRDAFNRVVDVPGFTKPAPDGAVGYHGVQYDQVGVMKRLEMANGLALVQTPDQLHRPAQINYSNGAGQPVLKLGYAYRNHEMNIASIAKNDTDTSVFDYDVLDQLTAEGRPDAGKAIEVRVAGLSASSVGPGDMLTVTYAWLARPTPQACLVETTFIDNMSGTILYRDTHDPATYTGLPTTAWPGSTPLSYARTLPIPESQYAGEVIVTVALVCGGQRQLLSRGEGVTLAGDRCYAVASFTLQNTDDTYHENLLHDDFRDTSRVDLEKTTAFYDADSRAFRPMTETVEENEEIYHDLKTVSQGAAEWQTVRSFDLYIDSADQEYNFRAVVRGMGYYAVRMGGREVIRHYSDESDGRTYQDKVDVSGFAPGLCRVEVRLYSTAFFGSIVNDSLRINWTARSVPVGGRIVNETIVNTNQLIFTEGVEDTRWSVDHTFRQTGEFQQIKVRCAGGSILGGWITIKVNGKQILNETVPAFGDWSYDRLADVSDVAAGESIRVQAMFTWVDPTDVSTTKIDTSSGFGTAIYVTKKKVVAREYTVVGRPVETERRIESAAVGGEQPDNVQWQMVKDDDHHAHFEAVLSHVSTERPTVELSKYTGALALAAANDEVPSESERGFAYDPAGNREEYNENGVAETQVIGPGNRLLSSGDISFEYDDNGNMTERVTPEGTWTYAYDARNCLVEVQKDSQTVAEYIYDPEDHRIWAEYDDGTSLIYHFDLTGQATENPIVEEEAGKPPRNYIYLNRKLLARVDGTIESGTKYWFMTDHLGSARGMADETGSVVWQADYEAFGKVKTQSGTVEEVPRFTGKAWDEKVGLYYFNARWYDAGLGRFVEEDALKNQRGLVLYIYCSNSPLTHTDPSGMRDDPGPPDPVPPNPDSATSSAPSDPNPESQQESSGADSEEAPEILYVNPEDGIAIDRNGNAYSCFVTKDGQLFISAVPMTKEEMKEVGKGSGLGLIWPCDGVVTSKFGYRKSFKCNNGKMSSSNHNGIDIAEPGGCPIVACGSGKVIAIGKDPDSSGGYSITIDHGNGVTTTYCHLEEVPDFSIGDHVEQGQEIGFMGETGNATGIHLHFILRIDGEPVDPLKYLPQGA